jgi:heme a synthase
MTRFLRVLVAATAALTFVVIVVGAYVRLSDAGLGCPDWPGCYGHPMPKDIADGDALAKAWKEMGHRYLAGGLGILILLVAVLAWKTRRLQWLATGIVALVLFQATLGKWTVTMLLKPAIVTAHLMGGMAILSLLLRELRSACLSRPAGLPRRLPPADGSRERISRAARARPDQRRGAPAARRIGRDSLDAPDVRPRGRRCGRHRRGAGPPH